MEGEIVLFFKSSEDNMVYPIALNDEQADVVNLIMHVINKSGPIKVIKDHPIGEAVDLIETVKKGQ